MLNEAIYPEKGSLIKAFCGANNAVGSIFLKFLDRIECNAMISQMDQYLKILVE